MIQDLKFAIRQLLKSPGFTAIAVFTLALAIGVNSAIFALVNGIVLKPVVPLKPEEVVNVFNARQGASKEYRQFSWNEYQALKEGREVFADVAAVQFALAGLGRDEGMRRSFAFFAFSWNSHAACIFPWSVIASASIPRALARLTSSGTLQAPSRSE